MADFIMISGNHLKNCEGDRIKNANGLQAGNPSSRTRFIVETRVDVQPGNPGLSSNVYEAVDWNAFPFPGTIGRWIMVKFNF